MAEDSLAKARAVRATRTTPIKTELTPKQLAYVEARSNGLNIVQSAQAAGYSRPDIVGYKVEKTPAIQAAIQKAWKKHEKAAEMSKKKVLDGMLYAIDQAKILADPTAQISGWREIAKMCGYYEPKKMQVEVSVSAKRMLSQFEVMSDAELLQLANTADEAVTDVVAREISDDEAEDDDDDASN